MRVILTHKIALNPTQKQKELLACAVGVARFAYNWALAEWSCQYKAGEKPSEAALRRQLNAIKREAFPWMLDVPKSVVQQAIKNLGKAFKAFFAKRSRYPRFKKRWRRDSARFDNGPGTFSFQGNSIRLPVIGWIKMRECLRFGGKPLSATVSRIAGRWFVTLSTGETITTPKPLKRVLKQLQRLSRRLSRKKRGSNNLKKTAARLARLHYKVSCIRQDFLHKLTRNVVRRFCVVGIEDLNIRGMLRNHRLARAISDVGWGEARRQLEYKLILSGGTLVVHDRWFASSKTCSACGGVLDVLPLSVRTWTCTYCGATHDRDVNAAINLKPTASCAGSYACGEEGSGLRRKSKVKPASSKQESTLYRLILE